MSDLLKVENRDALVDVLDELAIRLQRLAGDMEDAASTATQLSDHLGRLEKVRRDG